MSQHSPRGARRRCTSATQMLREPTSSQEETFPTSHEAARSTSCCRYDYLCLSLSFAEPTAHNKASQYYTVDELNLIIIDKVLSMLGTFFEQYSSKMLSTITSVLHSAQKMGTFCFIWNYTDEKKLTVNHTHFTGQCKYRADGSGPTTLCVVECSIPTYFYVNTQ